MKKFVILIGLIWSAWQVQAQEKVTAETILELKNLPETQLLDVRTEKEYQDGHIANAQNLDWKNLEGFKAGIAQLDKSKPVYVYCFGGGRSKQAAAFLTENGFTVFDYSGGMMDWRNADQEEIKASAENQSRSFSLDQYEDLIKSNNVVLVNFSATWCAPCQELKPIILKIQKEQSKKVKVVQLDADENRGLLKLLRINGIPKLVLYKNGKQVWSHTGVISESKIIAQVNKVEK